MNCKNLMKVLGNYALRTMVPAAGLFLCTYAAVCPISCRSSVEGIDVLCGDYSVPHISSFRVLDSASLSLEFTKEAVIKNAGVYSLSEEGDHIDTEIEVLMSQASEDGLNTVLTLGENTVTGQNYVVEGQVMDSSGNTLTFSIPFLGFNDNPARVIITEVRNSYATASVNKEKVHRSEYVELYVLKGGNLSGIEVLSAHDGEKKKYVLPSIEVDTGEYIVVHMRTIKADGLDGQGMISEKGDNLALSTHMDSCDTARDLWSANEDSVFADSDIVYVKNNAQGCIDDALLFAKSTLEEWDESFDSIVSHLEERNVWQGGCSPQNAVCSDDVTTSSGTRSYSRQNLGQCIEDFKAGRKILNGKDVWLITAAAGKVPGVTPGYANSSNPYVKKTS